jgi:hypothetical protein
MSKRWGEPTWYFFHTFIEKISQNFYNDNYKECIEIYKIICNNLPCPICKDHAIKYLKDNNVDKMNTRYKMKIFLFNFHNSVNERLKKKIYSEEILEQYQRITLKNAYKFFEQEFYKKNYFTHNFSSWIRNKMKESLDEFFVNNIQHFYY